MGKRLCLVLGMVVAGMASATTWTFTLTEKNANGWWFFNNAQNWRNEAGETGLPQEGDRIECLVCPDGYIAATLNDVYLSRVHFGPDNTQSVGHRGFYLKESAEAGDGFVYAPSKAGSMWCGLYLDGTVTVDVQQAVTLSFQAGVGGRNSTHLGWFVKTGPGTVRAEDCGDASKHLPHLLGGVIREGTFSLGMKLPMKVAGKEFFFDGTEGTAWLKVQPAWGSSTVTPLTHEFVDGHIHTATNRLPLEGHGLTDDGTGHTLVLSGASPVAEQYFEGRLAGALNFVWNPADAAKAFRFARASSPSTGELSVQNGIVRLTDGATFTGLSRLAVGATAAFEVTETAGPLELKLLTLAAGGRFDVAAGQTVLVHTLWQDGRSVADGAYTAADAEWLTGAGTVVVDRYRGTYGENQIVLTVPDGATQTLEEALVAANAAGGTSYTFDGLNGGVLKDWTLVKRGAGTLRLVSTNANFVGTVHLEAGVADVVARYGLGKGATDAGPIYVHAGATLLCTHPAPCAGTDFRNGNRIVHVAGTGVDGTGALKGTGGLIAYGTGPIFGCEIVLDDDALVLQSGWYCPANILTLNGYTLTLKGTTVGEPVLFDTVKGDGRLVLDGCQSRGTGVTFTGTAPGNVVEFRDGAGVRFWSSAGDWGKADSWPLVFTGATTYLYGDQGTRRGQGLNTLAAPMRIDGVVRQDSQGNTDYSSIFLQGPVSGDGSVFVAARDGGTENNYFHLLNPANTFTGGARVQRGILCVYEDGSLPPTGELDIEGSFDLTRQGNPAQMCDFYGVQLLGVEPCTLPPLRLRGTKDIARVQGGRGAWRSIVKEDANAVGYYSEAGAPLLVVREGTLRLPRGAAPGLWEGVTPCADTAAAQAAVAGDACTTNYVTRGPTSANQVPCDLPVAPDVKRLVTYTGYLWNRTGAAKTVTFAQSLWGLARLKVNGETVIDATGGAMRTAAQVVLRPGANAFEFRAQNCTPYYTDAEEKAGTWNRHAGLVWDAEGRAPSSPLTTDNFTRLVDPGDGSLFTRSASPTENLPVFDAIRLGEAATLDINGTAYTAQDLSGGGTVLSSATDAEAAPSLTLRKLTVNAGARETLRVEVPVRFADDFALSVTNAARALTGQRTVLTSTTPLTGVPRLVTTGDDGRKWTAYVSQDGTSLLLAHTGLTIILR